MKGAPTHEKPPTHSPGFNVRVAVEASSGRMTTREIAAYDAVCLGQVSQWMGQLLDGAREFPLRRRSPTPLRQRCNGLGGKPAPMVNH